MKQARGYRTNPKVKSREGRRPSRVNGHHPPRYLFDCWPQVQRAVYSAKHVALFLDFDGTLAPLRKRPGDVEPLGPPLRRVLRRLAGHERVSVYVISGRPLRELKKLVPVPRISLLGLHGWEGRATPPLARERRLLRRAKQLLQRRLPNSPQIWVEDKGLGLAVHYRGAPPGVVRRARPIVDKVIGILGAQIHMMQGHKVWELLPHQIDGKGSAVTALLSKLPEHTLPVFVGDDTTDESAFGALPHGLTIHVGENRRTRARFLLRNPEEVEAFLMKLGAAIG